ncbi:sodium:proton antiporter [Virgibacillus halodenitrificans]|uniref:Dicarboxylate/amino acid:cation symporter n=1 Tax=Virgibacillus halodenitrificans TaxID=1482 RepID=A0AAC9IXY8_VIRHA|nr:dicarboxylate/amino acid:cation symporter [Virgibacillus halodenitrificans]APC47971.1 sodium:proton antiporter [Virgibacillus halodenitrificans]MBD1223868.1 dicarboxylate/amino acid:cation symporter [Virgibacillus halodenitrificans]MCJ0931809.1 dicarboxylate/amino acid:cation symporter [Virgibacillus halodenitrificans]MEC2159792.1 dicarboxylate/amino acid:cation symporter [Virgibacillus halodenitrificans]CDQ37054.1 Aerobic C4-dicarboxylate transport protein [Virgibacillus halodenitrificans]
MKGIGLLIKIIIAIVLGIAIGSFSNEWWIQLFATFNGLFGNFLGFVIPLIILGFIAPGIGSMGRGAGKLLGLTGAIAYTSTILAGVLAFIVAKSIYPTLLSGQSLKAFSDPSEGLSKAFFEVEMAPLMGVMTALLLSFVIGLGIASIKGDTLLRFTEEFRDIIHLVIEKVIIPLLPFHIFGIFANMTYAGQVSTILSVFAKVFVMIVILHILYLTVQYTVAGTLSKQNPFSMLKRMLPAYFTALGTQSSAATIPVTLKHTKTLKVRDRVADFTVPLLANIHLSGSTITLVSCALAVMFLQGDTATFSAVFPFILMLGVTMVAAPGVPGGAVMAAIGLLESMLGFGPTMVSLMIALYLAQDSLGTACNVTGDGAITSITNSLSKNKNHTETEQVEAL